MIKTIRLDSNLTTALYKSFTYLQEAQLLHRGRKMLRVVGNFAKSLKIIPPYTGEHGVCKFLLVFYRNYVPILYRFQDKAKYWSTITIF